MHFTNYTYKATKANELQDERKEEEEMGVGMKRGSALTLFVVMMLLHTKTCRAATSPLRKSNTTTIINGCSGNLQKCLIGDVDSELLLDLETSSSLVLLNVGKFLALNTNEPKKPAVPCGNIELASPKKIKSENSSIVVFTLVDADADVDAGRYASLSLCF